MGVIAAVVFDIDDTLINFHALVKMALTECLDGFPGLPQEPFYHTFEEAFHRLDRSHQAHQISFEQMRRLRWSEPLAEFGVQVSDSEIDDLNQTFRAVTIREAELYPGVRPVLEALRPHVKLAVATNGPSVTQRAKLRKNGIETLFDRVAISEEIGISKPKAGIFHYALAAIARTNEAVMVGDSPEMDVVGGCEAGLRTVWVSHGRSWPAHLPPPHGTIEEIRDIVHVEWLKPAFGTA